MRIVIKQSLFEQAVAYELPMFAIFSLAFDGRHTLAQKYAINHDLDGFLNERQQALDDMEREFVEGELKLRFVADDAV